MTENTIVFTPQAELRKGLRFFTKGTALIFRSLAKIVNAAAHRFPWFFIIATMIVSVALSFIFIGKARAERDATNKRAYMLQQKVENYEMADEARREVVYARHAH